MSDPLLLTERVDHGVVLATLNRPAARNAIPPDGWAELAEMTAALQRDPEVAALVLTGAGAGFCAGADLKAPPPEGPGPYGPASRVRAVNGALEGLGALRCPVVAAVEGFAVGVGWSLALACDLVVAARDARFAAPFVARGLVPDGGLAWMLARRLGRRGAFALLVESAELSAVECHARGLVERLVDPGTATTEAVAWATALATGPRATVALLKRLVHDAERLPLTEHLRHEEAAVALNAHGPDLAEGRRAFREGRAPRWQAAVGPPTTESHAEGGTA